MRSQSLLIRIGVAFYLVLFFSYLLGPLILMSITGFNSSSFPQVTPWEVLSFEWFSVLYNDDRIINGLKNSVIVGFFTVILSLIMGLAGALMLTQIWRKLRSTFYTVIIAPILVPGVVIGISTLVFWDRINVMLGLSDDSFLHNGIVLTVLGQSTFIASYCMLVFVARLQRYDTGLSEAALDLGATHVQTFRKIQLPFLMPAIGSAAVLAFLASFENYNTTTFTFQKYPTLTIELVQKVRYGINPSISVLAFIIVSLTIFFALVHEVRTRRAQLAVANGAPVGAVSGGGKLTNVFAGNPAAVVLALFIATALAVFAYAQVYDPEPAKAVLLKKKRADQQKRIKALQERLRQQRLREQMSGPKALKPPKKSLTPFGNVFAPKNLNQVGGKRKPEPVSKKKRKSPFPSPFGNVFAPTNLDKVGGGKNKQPGAGRTTREKRTKRKHRSPFGNVFDPGNLKKVQPGK